MVIATISYTLMQFVDRLMVAYHSEQALAAVLPATMISFVPGSFLLGIMTTVNTFVSQSFGRGQYKDCSHYCWQAIYLGLIYSCVTFAVMWPLAPYIFKDLMHQPADIIGMEVTYLRIMLYGQFVVVFVWAGNQFFVGIHRPSVTMETAIISQVINIIANYALIFGKWGFPQMGIAGAAWGTVIGAGLGAILRMGVFLVGRNHAIFHSRETLTVDLHKIWDLLRIGTPAGLAFTVNTALLGTLLFRLIGRFGTESLAATSAVYSCTALSFMPVVGMGVALTAAVGKSIGNDRKDQATRQVSICLRLSLFYMGLVGLCFLIFRHRIIAAWHLGPAASAIGTHLLICAVIFQVFDAVEITYNGALRGAGDTLWLCVITTVGAGTILGLGGWFFVTFYPQWGAIGPWIAYTLHVIFVGLANRRRFMSNHWRNIDLFKREGFTTPIDESA